MWTLHKGQRRLSCDVATHPIGWDLRLEANAEVIRSQVGRNLKCSVSRTNGRRKVELKAGPIRLNRSMPDCEQGEIAVPGRRTRLKLVW